MSYAVRVKLFGKIEVARDPDTGDLTKCVFNDFINVPPRVIREVVPEEGVIYLSPECGLQTWGRALNLQYLDILARPGEDTWGPEKKKLWVFFPISRVVEYGVVTRPPS